MYSVEIRDENTADGAVLCAKLALCTKAVVDGCEIVHDLDRTRGAILFALLTSDTSVTALLSCNRALILVVTSDEHALNVVHNADYSSRASLGTKSAADALSGVDVRHSVLDADRALRTDLYAVAKTDASVGAFSVAAVHSLYRLAGAYSDVIHLMSGMLAVAVTMNYSHLLDYVLELNTEYRRDLLCRRVAAGDTKICLEALCLLISRKRLCVSVASRVAAGSAVCTGQTLAYLLFGLVLFNRKELCRKNEHHSADKSDARDYCRCYKYIHTYLLTRRTVRLQDR